MKIPFVEDPKITFAVIKLQDLLAAQSEDADPDFAYIVPRKKNTLDCYQPVFNPNHLPKLGKEEFEFFLLFRNNHHWDSLQRVETFITEDMGLLREALGILLDETRPIQERLNEIRPERSWAQNSMVSHLGMPVLTAILQIMYPDKYGVWNNTSDAGLKIVGLWDKKWKNPPAGDRYVEMNEIYLYLCQELKIDLWTLDVLWWVLKKKKLGLQSVVGKI